MLALALKHLDQSERKFFQIYIRIIKDSVSLMILVSITIFSTVLGVGYLKEALLDAISILNFGTVVSEYRPLQNPLQ
jgi:hypothetical protein